MLVTLLVGGLLSATLKQCPAFGWLLVISVAVALISGYVVSYILLPKAVTKYTQPLANARATAAAIGPSLPDVDDIKSKVAELKQRLSRISTE